MSVKKSGTPAQRPNNTILSRTLVVMIVCGIVAFIVLGVNLYKIQINEHDKYEQMAVEQQTRSTTIAASRGTITDKNGNTLAMSATAYTVFLSPHDVEYYKEDINAIADGLSRILDIDRDSIIEKSKDTASYYKTLAKKLEDDKTEQVRQFISDGGYKSIHIENDTKRYYPYGSLACHVIGFVGTDNTGLDGIESRYDSYLTGTDGRSVRLTANNGTEMLLDSYEDYYDAIDGDDIELTIDVTIQSIAEKYLEQAIVDNRAQNGGCCIVMDVNTGAVLAMASKNDYDLNNYLEVSDADRERIELIEDEEARSEELKAARLKQWRNKAVSDTYEPGSVFKIITMAMALEENAVSETEDFYCGGKMQVLGRTADNPLNCWKHAGHGSQTLKEAAMHSCNVAFANIGMRVGASTFYDYVEAFGLFDKTGLDLPTGAEASSQWWSREAFCRPYDLSSLAAASFGQTFNVTPIQMITAISAVANGGYLMEPHVVNKITNNNGETVYSSEKKVVRQVLSNATSKKVCEILEAVVGEDGGTGSNAYVAGYRVAGKTGTTTKTTVYAATGIKEYMVSFCGFAPADNPRIAVLVILDNPVNDGQIYVSGGVMAAPAVGKIIGEVLPYLGVEPVYTDGEASMIDVTVPRLVDLSISDATAKAAEKGLGVRTVGDGDTVTGQLPAANAEVTAGTEIILYAGETAPEDEVTVPNLKGMSVTKARQTLADKGLYLDTSGASPSNDGAAVSSQSVQEGETVKYGSVIKVFLADGSNIGQY